MVLYEISIHSIKILIEKYLIYFYAGGLSSSSQSSKYNNGSDNHGNYKFIIKVINLKLK